MLASAAVRERLAVVPIGRQVAARHADRLFGAVAGFAHSQMLAAALELGVFERLRGGPVGRGALLDSLGLPDNSARALVQALMALRLVEAWRGDRLGLSIDGLVVATDEGIATMIRHNHLLYRDLADPLAMLRVPGSGAVGAFWPYAGQDGDATAYSAVMAASQTFVGESVANAHDFGRYDAVLDIGGGDGSFVALLARRWPAVRLGLVELPAVVPIARAKLAEAGVERVSVHERAGRCDPLPGGYDAITLVRVLHDQDDDAAVILFSRAREALGAGGMVVVAEPMARRGRDPQTAYFTAYFVAMGSGRIRSAEAIRRLGAQAGLTPQGKAARAGPLISVQVLGT